MLQTPESFNERFQVDVRVNNEVLSINKEEKYVEVRNRDKDFIYRESYDVLVLSPGSTPLKPPIEGIDSPNIFSLWNIPDVDKIKAYVEENNLKTATVIGGGFIGLEMAENLHDLGLKVSIAEMAPQVMMPVDYDLAQILHKHIGSKDIDLYLDNGVKRFDYSDANTDVILLDDTVIKSDIVLLAIGIRPNGELAKNAGLSTNARGGIIVNEYLRTSDKDIFALGDVIEVKDFVSGDNTMIPLAGPANKQGRIVADNIVGLKVPYKGTQGTSVAKVFDMTVATTGNNEKSLLKQGMVYGKDYHVAIVARGSHAGYYPGAKVITLKIIFDNGGGKILGAQAVGEVGVEKRIDVIATAIRFGGTVNDLMELELAYAPPYSSAKDPVNMVAYVANNIMVNKMTPIRSNELVDLDSDHVIILDVRTPYEVKYGSIDNAINIPVDELRNRLDELPLDKEIVVYCAVGFRGYIATTLLNHNGYKTRNLIGGYNLYSVVEFDHTSGKELTLTTA